MTLPRVAPAPLLVDPAGSPTDPVVVRGPAAPGTDPADAAWWMLWTQRRPSDTGPGVTWVHGTGIAAATSVDGGLTWTHRGLVAGLDPAEGRNTLWAPEVVHVDGRFHMLLTWVPGVPDRWEGVERRIHHLVSDDLVTWEHRGPVPLTTDRAIDACLAPLPGGGYRMWFKDEAHGSHTWAVDSPDLESWGEAFPVLTHRAHEGPNVFRLGGWWWMVVDEWRGQAVHRSRDLTSWEPAGHVLDRPGTRPLDSSIGNHADVVVGREADGTEVGWIFYFTHEVWPGDVDGLPADPVEGPDDPTRRCVVQVATLRVVDDRLVCDRDAPVDLDLRRAVDA